MNPLVEPLSSANRWVVRRKVALIEAVRSGAITLDEAYRRYQLSREEFIGWLSALEKHGAPGLRATRFQIYRDNPGSGAPTVHQEEASSYLQKDRAA